MEEDIGPVILINKFNVDPDKLDVFLEAWKEDGTYFKQQPGFISAQQYALGGLRTDQLPFRCFPILL